MEKPQGGGGHTVLTPRGWAPHHLKCKEEAQSNPASPYPNILHHHFLNRDKDWSRYPLPVTPPTIGGTWAAVQMGMGVHGREGEHRAPEPDPFKEGGGPPGQGGEIVQGRAQARAGSSTQRGRGGGRYPHPQQNWVVKNLKLDFNKTNRKGYVQNGGGFNPKGRVRELFSPPQQGALAGKGLRGGLLSHRAAAYFPHEANGAHKTLFFV